MVRMKNVVVFGDSLSDIGKMIKTLTGKFAQGIGQMFVNSSGRFSDSKNWTDHMYEEATSNVKTLVYFDPRQTIAESTLHQSFTKGSVVEMEPAFYFRYANYAKGGACGDEPYDNMKKPFLETFEQQFEQFKSDLLEMRGLEGDNWLFPIWFGANDLFTAKAPPWSMPRVALKIMEVRTRLEGLVQEHGGLAHFIHMNLGYPTSTPRYNDPEFLEKEKLTEQDMNELSTGVDEFNNTLSDLAPESVVDIASIMGGMGSEKFEKMIRKYRLLKQAPPEGFSKTAQPETIRPQDFNMLQSRYGEGVVPERPMTTEDGVHPTTRVHYRVWRKIRKKLIEKQYTFGTLTRDEPFVVGQGVQQQNIIQNYDPRPRRPRALAL